MGYHAELPTTNARIEAVRARIAEREAPIDQDGDVLYIGFDKPPAKSHKVPRSGEQGLRLNRKQRRKARQRKRKAEQVAIERTRYAMYAQEARADIGPLRDEIMVLRDQVIDYQDRISELVAENERLKDESSLWAEIHELRKVNKHLHKFILYRNAVVQDGD